MLQIINTMSNFFAGSKQEGSYFLLLAISIFALYKMDKTKNRWYILYVVALVLLVVGNPLTIWLLSLVFPAVAGYSFVIPVLPILIFIPYTATELLFTLKTSKERYILTAVLFIYVSLCGNLFGTFGGNTVTAENYYDSEKKEIVRFVDEKDPKLLLGDTTILPFIVSYGDNVPLLYGADLWKQDLDLGYMDEYDEEIYRIFDLMQNPVVYMPQIADLGNLYGCDIIIVDNFEGHKAAEGEYTLGLETDHFLVYMKR
jgi:hypothetical protein